MNIDRGERCDQRIHIDHWDPTVDQLVHGRGQCADANAWIATKSHFCAAMLSTAAAASVRPAPRRTRHLHVEQPPPVFRSLLALCTPCGLKSGVGKGCLLWLVRSPCQLTRFLRERWVDAERSQPRGSPGQRPLQELSALGLAASSTLPPDSSRALQCEATQWSLWRAARTRADAAQSGPEASSSDAAAKLGGSTECAGNRRKREL